MKKYLIIGAVLVAGFLLYKGFFAAKSTRPGVPFGVPASANWANQTGSIPGQLKTAASSVASGLLSGGIKALGNLFNGGAANPPVNPNNYTTTINSSGTFVQDSDIPTFAF